MRDFNYLIVGGGLAAASAVDGIRAVDPEGSILLVTEESDPPYHRPPLSKEYLQTPEVPRTFLHVKPQNWFEAEAGVTLRTEERIVSLNPRTLTVTAAGGHEYRAERILLATGGRPRTLELPGSDLKGVFSLRTVEDAEAIQEAAGDAEDAVLVGAGFVGLEVAASLTKLGVRATVVELEKRVWPQMLPARLSEFVRAHMTERGVRWRLGANIREFRGQGRLEAVVLESGETLLCQLAVVGIGITPSVELAEGVGIAVKDGIIVDRFGETTHGYVYAAGDVARFPDPVFGDTARVEHWEHAKEHGKRVGRNMAGEHEPYEHLSYFFTEVFDLSMKLVGRPADADQLIVQGELRPERSVVLCGSEGRLCAAILINANDELSRCRELVRRRPLWEELEKDQPPSRAELGALIDADV